jgi:beta-glucoside operon transcriptional antiterminator
VVGNVHVLKRINNNVVLAEQNGKKTIVMGNGIGFKVYPYDLIDEKRIEQTFVPQMESEVSYWADILKEIPLKVLAVSQKVLEIARMRLGKTLSSKLDCNTVRSYCIFHETIGRGNHFESSIVMGNQAILF